MVCDVCFGGGWRVCGGVVRACSARVCVGMCVGGCLQVTVWVGVCVYVRAYVCMYA